VLPIVTPEEMRAIDAAAPDAEETLIERAGSAVAWAALRMLGGAYGRRVVVLAGHGNNGNDGRVAARRLSARGVQVRVIDATSAPASLPDCDLVIDAAFGTGFRGEWKAPDAGQVPVLAVDIPSGVDGATGAATDGVMPATRTVTFAALKPGLLFSPGAELAGTIEVADIGLSCDGIRAHLVQRADVAAWWRPRAATAHKWNAAVRVVAGSPGMTGAAHLCAGAAQRAGAGMVHLSVPGAGGDNGPHEHVHVAVPMVAWSPDVLEGLERFQALVVGPGLGRDDDTVASVRDLLRRGNTPAVVDGDGLFALSPHPGVGGAGSSARATATALLAQRDAPTVLTPHDGEFAALAGHPPGSDRIAAARGLAASLGVVVLLKGPATVIAEPTGRVLVVDAGDDRLATAGTGDVLSGIIGALVARGVEAFEAAAAGAWIHGVAACSGPRHGFIAGDLLPAIPRVLDQLA
jgi:hydroxyethylthiazole kinase-like uncharacterized protein yjeF